MDKDRGRQGKRRVQVEWTEVEMGGGRRRNGRDRGHTFGRACTHS